MPLDPEAERLRKGSFSFPEVTLHQLETLAAQRRRERDTDLQKRALAVGTLFLSIEEGPDRETGRYGDWEVADFAATLRKWVIWGSDFLEQHGYPLRNASDLSSLLGVLASNMNALNPTETPSTAPLEPSLPPAESEEVRIEPLIGDSTLSRLNLDDTPML